MTVMNQFADPDDDDDDDNGCDDHEVDDKQNDA